MYLHFELLCQELDGFPSGNLLSSSYRIGLLSMYFFASSKTAASVQDTEPVLQMTDFEAGSTEKAAVMLTGSP